MTTYIASTSGGEIDGSAGNDVMIGKSGDDTFDGGTGSDILFGGAGNDIIYYDEIDIRVDGGTGHDTLVFNGTGQSLNLGLQKTVMNFEKIELSGGGGHSLTFSAADVLRTSDLDSLLIRGTSSSTVNFADGGWIFQSYSGGQSTFINGSASVIIDNAVNVAGFSNNAVLSLGSGSETELTEDQNPDSDDMLVATGTILVSDQNVGQALLRATVTPSGTPHGELALGASSISGLSDGSYVYTVSNAAAQQLGANESWTDKFIVTSVDGSTMTLEFKVNGVNDNPVRQGYDSQGGTITEITDKALGENSTPHTVSGSFVIRDVDATDSLNYWIESPDGHRGSLAVSSISSPDTNGNRVVLWEYTVNDASLDTLDAKNYAENYTIYLSDRVKDTAGAAVVSVPVNLTLQGSNDAPILQPVSSIIYHDTDGNDSFADTVGNLSAEDVDENDLTIYRLAESEDSKLLDYDYLKETAYGIFYLNMRSGAYKFSPKDGAIEALKNTVTVNFSVTANDDFVASEVQNITVTLNGVNDAPIRINDASDVTSGSVTELASIDPNANSSSYMHEVSGSFKVQDVDLGDTLSLSGIIHTSTGMTQYGGLIIDSISSRDNSGIRTVNWSYSVSDQDLNPLAAGSGPTENFAISLTDGTATLVQNVSVALTGTADGPTFSGDLLKTVTEFADTSAVENTGFHTITGTIQISNLPAGGITAKMVNFPGSNSFGMFSSTVSGITLEGKATVEWTYTVADCLLDFLGGSATYRDGTTLEISYSANPFDIKSVNIDLMGAMDSLSDKKVASYGSIGDDIKTIAQVGPYQVYGSGGNDLLITGSDLRTQTLFGDTGDDRFQLSIGKSLSIGDVGQDYFDFFPALDKIIQAFAWGGQDEDTFDIVKMESSSIAWAMDFRLGEDRIDVMSTAQMYEMTLKYTTASDTTSRGYNPFVPDGTSYYALSGPGASDSTITFNIIGSPLQASDLTSILI